MLYDRPYMKVSQPGTKKLGALVWLIIAELTVFALQYVVLLIDPEAYRQGMRGFFALSGNAIASGKVWTLLTYGFLHDTGNIFHILFNMLGLYFGGRIVARVFGDKALLEVFFLSMLTGGLLYVLFHLGGSIPVTGASGALMGIIALLCLLHGEQEMTLLLWFIIPVTLKPKWILWGLIGFALVGIFLWEIPGASTSTTAHSAHLGGILGGIAYFQFLKKGKSLFNTMPNIHIKKPVVATPKKSKIKKVAYTVNFASKDKLRAEVDRILDKINEQGFGSLTEEERKTLDEARDILRK